ncbi:MAG: cytochrome c family protein [Acidobacteriota bacterium]|nr:MAG: cytochrome c family protein [Acidobacteriota bacterium]
MGAQEKNSYEGVAVCGMCHKSAKQGEQLKIWQGSKHAQAFKTLQTAEAKEIAKKQGLTGDPEKEEACLRCHATGHNVDAALLGKKFSIEDGVQCETCHGPGSGYKSMKVMKDQKASIAAGLIVHGDNMGEYCATCHNAESPTYKEFDTAARWEEIKHPVPK